MRSNIFVIIASSLLAGGAQAQAQTQTESPQAQTQTESPTEICTSPNNVFTVKVDIHASEKGKQHCHLLL